MNRNELLQRLCQLTAKVGAQLNHPAACFCANDLTPYLTFDENILAYIETVVAASFKEKS